jgi:hypothetical protein
MLRIGYAFTLLAVGALLSPGVPIALSWAHSYRVPEMWNIVSLSAASLSFIWLITVGWHPVLVSTLGGYYPERPFAIIWTNLLVMLVCAGVTLARSSRPSQSTLIACAMVALLWMSIAPIQSRGTGLFSKWPTANSD